MNASPRNGIVPGLKASDEVPEEERRRWQSRSYKCTFENCGKVYSRAEHL